MSKVGQRMLHAPVAASISIGRYLNASEAWVTPDECLQRKEVLRVGLATTAVEHHEQWMRFASRARHTDSIAHTTRVTRSIEVVALTGGIIAAHQFGRSTIIGALTGHLTCLITDATTQLRITP